MVLVGRRARSPSVGACYVLPGAHSDGEPAVKYRGIFLNDEAPALTGWAREKFGGVNHQFYEKVFELILRLKGNYLWPAMWGNAFNDDDKLDPQLADDYGIVMGTSHHEPMLRAQQEWKRYGKGEWNYEHNDSTLRAFWARGHPQHGDAREHRHRRHARRRRHADDDGQQHRAARAHRRRPARRSSPTVTEQARVRRRRSSGRSTRKCRTTTTRACACPTTSRCSSPTTTGATSGGCRRAPTRARAGGFGVYYHFDYVGGPRNYKWINTNPIARVWEQMHLAYEYGANRIWIVNVGDLKPMEFPISFFLDYAWNPNRIPAERLPAYTRRWAAQQFGAEHATEIAEIMTRRRSTSPAGASRSCSTPLTYSLTNYREAERVVASVRLAASRRDEDRSGKLPAERARRVLRAGAAPDRGRGESERAVRHGRAESACTRGRGARRRTISPTARAACSTRTPRSRSYYNTKLAGGKWDHMMDQTHIGYTYWQEPPRNTMPRVDVIHLPIARRDGRRGRRGEPRATAGAGLVASRELSLPAFDPYTRPTYHIDVYDRGKTAFAFTASAAEPWVVVSPAKAPSTKETTPRGQRRLEEGARRARIACPSPSPDRRARKPSCRRRSTIRRHPTRDSVSVSSKQRLRLDRRRAFLARGSAHAIQLAARAEPRGNAPEPRSRPSR